MITRISDHQLKIFVLCFLSIIGVLIRTHNLQYNRTERSAQNQIRTYNQHYNRTERSAQNQIRTYNQQYIRTERSAQNQKENQKASIIAMPYDNGALGFTNQIYSLISLIDVGCRESKNISHGGFKADLHQQVQVSLEFIIDLKATNQNLNCTQLIPYKDVSTKDANVSVRTVMEIGNLSTWNPYSPYIGMLIFQKSNLLWRPNGNARMPLLFYGIHFRAESDWIIFSSSASSYWDWMSAIERNASEAANKIRDNTIASHASAKFWMCTMDSYKDEISKHFTNKSLPVVIATGLGKENVHEFFFEWALTYLKVYLRSLNFSSIITGKGTSNYRELNSASEMVVMIDSVAFIGNNGTSFSQMIRNVRHSRNSNHSRTFSISQYC